jgi:hypothetical protein
MSRRGFLSQLVALPFLGFAGQVTEICGDENYVANDQKGSVSELFWPS